MIAGRAALESAGIRARQLSFIVVATSTPDQPQPPTAAVVADELGADQGTAAFDVNGVCTGFLFALATAQGMLASATGEGYALVIGADVYSRILNREDRRTTILFGDGAAPSYSARSPARDAASWRTGWPVMRPTVISSRSPAVAAVFRRPPKPSPRDFSTSP